MTTTEEHIAAIREALAEPEIARFHDFTKAVSAMANELDRLKAENERMREARIQSSIFRLKQLFEWLQESPDNATLLLGHMSVDDIAFLRAAIKGDTHGN